MTLSLVSDNRPTTATAGAVAESAIEGCLTAYAARMRTADALTLDHEAERLESLPGSPAIRRMRRLVDAELNRRSLLAAVA